jgi:hypothetical protein
MNERDVNPSQGFRPPDDQLKFDWPAEEKYWRTSWQSRPYASVDRGFEFYGPAYRYGAESATRFRGRQFGDVESDLRAGWDRYENRGKATWENIKDAVRDGWNRITNR